MKINFLLVLVIVLLTIQLEPISSLKAKLLSEMLEFQETLTLLKNLQVEIENVLVKDKSIFHKECVSFAQSQKCQNLKQWEKNQTQITNKINSLTEKNENILAEIGLIASNKTLVNEKSQQKSNELNEQISLLENTIQNRQLLKNQIQAIQYQMKFYNTSKLIRTDLTNMYKNQTQFNETIINFNKEANITQFQSKSKTKKSKEKGIEEDELKEYETEEDNSDFKKSKKKKNKQDEGEKNSNKKNEQSEESDENKNDKKSNKEENKANEENEKKEEAYPKKKKQIEENESDEIQKDDEYQNNEEDNEEQENKLTEKTKENKKEGVSAFSQLQSSVLKFLKLSFLSIEQSQKLRKEISESSAADYLQQESEDISAKFIMNSQNFTQDLQHDIEALKNAHIKNQIDKKKAVLDKNDGQNDKEDIKHSKYSKKQNKTQNKEKNKQLTFEEHFSNLDNLCERLQHALGKADNIDYKTIRKLFKQNIILEIQASQKIEGLQKAKEKKLEEFDANWKKIQELQYSLEDFKELIEVCQNDEIIFEQCESIQETEQNYLLKYSEAAVFLDDSLQKIKQANKKVEEQLNQSSEVEKKNKKVLLELQIVNNKLKQRTKS